MKIFAICIILFFLFSCKPSENTRKIEDLPPVKVNLRTGRFHIPGCELYNQVPQKFLLALPSAQEAELSGYRAAGGCDEKLIADRLRQEKEIIGEMKPTKETNERKERAVYQRSVEDINDKLNY